jgi:hypothetical protein
MNRRIVFGPLLAVLLAPFFVAAAPGSAAASAVTHDEFKKFLETRDALEDERVQKMPEKNRIPAIASRNFKMKASELQEILDKVEAAGGEKGVADENKKAVEAALAGTPVASRMIEVKLDTSAPHVVTYIVWTIADPERTDVEAALIAVKAGPAAPVTSTFRLIGRNAAGKDVYRANITADRTKRIREDRIEDWATTRYRNLFEVEAITDAAPAAPATSSQGPAAAAN